MRFVDAGNPIGNSTVVISGLDDAAAVDYYFDEKLVFYTDVSLQTIKKTRLDNSQVSVTIRYNYTIITVRMS